MAQPSNTTVLPRADLGVAVEEYKSDSLKKGFIGSQLMPPLDMAKQAATYPVIPKSALLADEDTKRSMRGYYNRSDWDFENGFYATQENGWEEALDDRERKLYKDLLDAELIAVNRATGIVLRAGEKRIAARLFNPANFTNSAVANKWNVYTDATPMADIADRKKAVRAVCGMVPNTLAISWDTFEDLKRCKEIVEQLKYTFPGEKINSMSVDMMAQIINIEKLLVGGAMINGAKKGQNASLSDIWDPSMALLTITDSSNDMSMPCVGRTFMWTEESGDGEDGVIVEEYRTEGNRSDIYRVRHDSDERLIKSYDESGNVLSDISKAVSSLITGLK